MTALTTYRMRANILSDGYQVKARRLLRIKLTDTGGHLTEMVVWQVPAHSRHPEGVRYRLAFIPHGQGRPAVLYDNHHPKGPHKHVEGKQSPYEFSSTRQLISDFKEDVMLWKGMRGWT